MIKIMKTIRLCFYLLIAGCFNSLFAQEEVGSGMLFPAFEKGTVIFKTGTRSSASLNYDMIRQQMLFLEADSTIKAIANSLDISVVIIGERRFLPVSSQGEFYEEVQAGKGSLFVKRKATLLSQGKAAAYGGYSQTSSTTSFSSWHDNAGNSVNLSVNEKFSLEIKCTYYLKIGNSYKSFFSAKSLGKLFKGHESEIEEYAKKQPVDFSKIEDVFRMVEYGYGLILN